MNFRWDGLPVGRTSSPSRSLAFQANILCRALVSAPELAGPEFSSESGRPLDGGLGEVRGLSQARGRRMGWDVGWDVGWMWAGCGLDVGWKPTVLDRLEACPTQEAGSLSYRASATGLPADRGC